MVNQENVLSNVLKMKNLYFSFIDFKSNGVVIGDSGTADVCYKEEHKIDDRNISISLFCRVEVKEAFSLEMCLVGDFEVSNIDNNRVIPNAIAIMFPYLRAEVSLVTSQPGIPSISLKPININAFLERQNKE